LRAAGWSCSLLLLAAWAQGASDFLVSNWSTADGLPDNTVRDIVETKDGYLWIGTANGLARFDGVRFRNYDTANSPGFTSANVLELAEDPEGGIWIATVGGTFRLFEGRFQSMHNSLDGPPVRLAHFATTTSGAFWMQMGTRLARWTGNSLEPFDLPEEPELIWSICAAPEGGLWVAAPNGLWRVDQGTATIAARTSLPRFISTTPDGSLWGLVGQRRLFCFRNERWQELLNPDDIRCATVQGFSNGDVWIGAASRHHAFRYRDGVLEEFADTHGLDGNRTLSFAEDRGGNIWIGMNGAGLYQLRPKRLRLYTQDDGFENVSLTSVVETQTGQIIAGVMGWAIHEETQNGFAALTDESTLALRTPTALVPATEGGIWAGQLSGRLPRLENGRVVEEIGADRGTRALFVDRDAGLWRAFRSGGIEHITKDRRPQILTTVEGLSSGPIYCFAQTPDGAIWAGSQQGLNRLDGHSIRQFGTDDGLGHQHIISLWTDSRGTLWAGTLGGGLSGWTGERFVTFHTRHGLPDAVISHIIEDDQEHLWIGTRAGLMRLRLDDLHNALEAPHPLLTGTLIGRREGIPRPDGWTRYQPASIKDGRGRLWFCTSSGLVRLNPEDFNQRRPPPIVHIEEYLLDGEIHPESLQDTTEAVVTPAAEELRLQFTALSALDPEALQFRYRLEDYDRDWIVAGRTREAAYSHLPPGSYRFRVQATDPGGSWSTPAAAIDVRVDPTLWQTSLFRATMVLAGVGLLTLGYRWRIGALERRRRAQEAFSRRLIDSQEAERKRIAAELHDSLGQNLLVIKNKAVLALTHQHQPDKMSTRLEEVSEMASTALREVRDIAQNLRPYQIDELGLTRSIAAVIRQCGDASEITFTTELDDIDALLPPGHQISFYRIVQESLNNIVKHSRATAAKIRLRHQGSRIILSVKDNGIGLANTGNGKHGFGIHNMTERVRAMNGQLQLTSGSDDGTRLHIELPISTLS
jgi:signal transduction histidine kinase/ligand-binding sensor domain-containing protein